MSNYPSNSHKSKQETKEPVKRVEKAVVSNAKVKKKSEIRKFTDIFVQEDVSSVKEYILMDVIVPAVKTAVSDVVKNGIDMLLYGEGGSSSPSKKPTASRVSYRSYYQNERDRREPVPRTARTSYNYDDIVLESRGEAEDVLTRMDELIATYGLVRVADYYDLVDVSANYTDNNYGWTDIHKANVVRVRDGYMINLPRAMPLD